MRRSRVRLSLFEEHQSRASPEKAGVGGSIPSLATTLESIALGLRAELVYFD